MLLLITDRQSHIGLRDFDWWRHQLHWMTLNGISHFFTLRMCFRAHNAKLHEDIDLYFSGRNDRRMSSVKFGGTRHFCPKIYAWKINKLPAFYLIFAPKIRPNKMPEFGAYGRNVAKRHSFLVHKFSVDLHQCSLKRERQMRVGRRWRRFTLHFGRYIFHTFTWKMGVPVQEV